VGFPLPVPALDAEGEDRGEGEDVGEEMGEDDEDDDDEPITPHTRRRSFLIDVINSTSRPRMKFPTPHPRFSGLGVVTPLGGVDGEGEEEEGDGGVTARLRTAFAGATPRFGGRPSHPLAQTFIPPSETSVAGSPPTTAPATSGLHLSSLQTPTPFSPYHQTPSAPAPDSDRASFISTASSHDLTTHAYARANASFDPIMGLGERGGTGVGRFNAGKLNAYLHGLNRRLAQENEGLVGRLRRIEEERGAGNWSVGTGRRLSAGGKGRRVSAGSALGDVEEDVGAEKWVEEKKELEEMVEMLTEEVNRCTEVKEEGDRALLEEREERKRDKERWKERMGEVEKGVEGIVSELERKVEDSEKKIKDVEQDRVMMERALECVEEERDSAIERAEKAERALGDGRELGGELKEANERIARVMSDLRNANSQIKGLEEEVLRSDGKVDELEKELKAKKASVGKLEAELTEVNTRLTNMEKEMKANKGYIAQLEADAGAAVELIENLEEKLTSVDERTKKMDAQEEKMDQLAVEGAAKDEFIRQLEEALEAGERRMIEDEEKVVRLEGRLASLESREKERKKERENDSLLDLPSGSRKDPQADVDHEIEALESELDDAHREIARLNTLINRSPARKAIEKAKDTKIEMLEKEKEDLLERVKMLRNTVNEIGSSNRLVNGSGISPIHRHVLSMSMRAPRTPGAPLREVSVLLSCSSKYPHIYFCADVLVE
jgi:predicted  nucleic acid-binding Zn-ribbon protein